MPKPNFGGKPQKAKDTKKALGRLIKYLTPFLPLIFVSMVLIIVATIIRLIGPNKIGEITDILQK